MVYEWKRLHNVMLSVPYPRQRQVWGDAKNSGWAGLKLKKKKNRGTFIHYDC
jgi:hypothetical protein